MQTMHQECLVQLCSSVPEEIAWWLPIVVLDLGEEVAGRAILEALQNGYKALSGMFPVSCIKGL